MSYFHRLTEIVTCNLSQLLIEATDPQVAIQQIVAEMEEGLMGARRSVATASANEDRLSREILEHRGQSEGWLTKAREFLKAGQELEARQALLRRREIDDLLAGLHQQHQAAAATREHLTTMQRALEARLAEALRRRQAIQEGEPVETPAVSTPTLAPTSREQSRLSEVDAELDAMRRELGLP